MRFLIVVLIVTASASANADDKGRSKRLAGIVIADVGVGAIALGVVFAVLSKVAGDAAYHPSDGVYAPAEDDRQRDYRSADIACFVIGGAMAVTGTTLWLLGRRQRHDQATASVGATPAYGAVGIAF